MSSMSIDIDYGVDKIVNEVTRQNTIRLKEVKRYPICILYGDFPQKMESMLMTELNTKMGSAGAVSFQKTKDVAMQNSVRDATSYFQEKMENSTLRMLSKYFIAVIFMADHLNAGKMIDDMCALQNTMKQEGFDGDYHICFYCIYDYAKMDGKECREQLVLLQQSEVGKHPVGIFTQNNMCRSDYQKYRKAVKSIAMHIFLQTMDANNIQNCLSPQNFVIGYWKFDVLKQKLVDYLIGCITRQEKRMISAGEYQGRVRQVIDEMMDNYSSDIFIAAFCKMPVNYNRLDELLHPGRRTEQITFGEAMQMMYGSGDPCREFLKANLESGDSKKYVKQFFSSDLLGNLYAIQNDLERALQEIQKEYQVEINTYSIKRRSAEDIFKIRHRADLPTLLNTLRKDFWETDAEIFRIERKVQLTDALTKHLNSVDFQTEIKVMQRHNEDEKKSLIAIRREAVMPENRIFNTVDFKLSVPENEVIPMWNVGIFDSMVLGNTKRNMTHIYEQVNGWMHENMVAILGDFIQHLQHIKSEHMMETYYSAHIRTLRGTKEAETLYIAQGGRNDNRDIQGLQEIVRMCLPGVSIQQCNWEANMCFELIAFKVIEDFSDIYNMN